MTSLPTAKRNEFAPSLLYPVAPETGVMDDLALLTDILRGLVADPAVMAQTLLSRFEGLAAVLATDPGELARTAGAGRQVATQLGRLKVLAVRLARVEASHRPVVASWSSLLAYARAALAHEPREQFRVLYLDKKNVLLRDELVAHGTIDHAPVYPREVVRRALEVSASSLILLHNHPSGDPTPSQADIEMTRKVVEAARVFALQVHDHLVIGRQGTASFKALGLI